MGTGVSKMTYRWFWKGIKHDISLCCILFFESAWSNLKHIDEYKKLDTKIQTLLFIHNKRWGEL